MLMIFSLAFKIWTLSSMNLNFSDRLLDICSELYRSSFTISVVIQTHKVASIARDMGMYISPSCVIIILQYLYAPWLPLIITLVKLFKIMKEVSKEKLEGYRNERKQGMNAVWPKSLHSRLVKSKGLRLYR